MPIQETLSPSQTKKQFIHKVLADFFKKAGLNQEQQQFKLQQLEKTFSLVLAGMKNGQQYYQDYVLLVEALRSYTI